MKRTLLHHTLIGVFLFLGTIASAQTVNGLTMDASSPNFSTNDILTADYTLSGAVESAAAWYHEYVPISLLSLPFEAGASNALLDFSGSGNDVTATGNPVWSATGGHNGTGAFILDGDDYFEAGEILPLTASYTKSAWIYSTGTGYRNVMSSELQGDNNHVLKVNPDGRINAGHSFGSYFVIDPNPMLNDQWYFVAVTFEFQTGEMILYRDGVEVARAIVPESLRARVDSHVLVGAKAHTLPWIGTLDDARLYDRALSPEQIVSLFTNGGDVMVPQETRGDVRWRVRVTPFSDSDVGEHRYSANVTLQPAAISGLTLTPETPAGLTNDDLTASFSENPSALESSTAWYRDGVPFADLYLPFEGGPFEALNDISGNDNHVAKVGNLLEDPVWDPTGGHDGTGGYVFDGDDHLVAGNIFPLNSSYTKSAWIYNTVLGYNNIISSVLEGNNNHCFKVNADGRLNAGQSFGTAVVLDPTPMALNTWYFVAVTFDYATGDMVLYKDGVEVNSSNVPEVFRSVVDPSVLVGSMNYLSHWDGNLDEIRIYDRALSPGQISAMYSGNNVLVSEETVGGELWRADVTPFSISEAGVTTASSSVLVRSVVVSAIPDQTILEGASFSNIDLDNYVTVYEFTPGDLIWSSSVPSELDVTINPANNVVSIAAPDAEWYGSEDISFVATNPNDDADTVEVTFTVTNVNDAPVLTVTGDQSTNEDTDLTGLTVDFTDADPTDAHTITVVSDDTNVTVALGGTPLGSTYDLEVAEDWNGSAEITVTVTDNATSPASDSETYTLVVNAINDAPVLTEVNDQSTDEDINLTGLAVVFDDVDDTDTHTITVVSDESNVTVANLSGDDSGSTYDLVPAAGWNGTAQITVTVTDDGTGPLNDIEIYTLTVNSVNDGPVLTVVGDQGLDEDNTLRVSVLFTDSDPGDSHTITVVSDETNVSVGSPTGNISGSTYDLVPAANWNGTAEITVTVTETGPGALFDTETYTLTVNPVNDAPTSVTLSNNSTDENVPVGTVIGMLSSADVDADDTHLYTFISDGGFMSGDNDVFIIVGDTLKTNAEINFEVSDVLWILVQSDDGSGGLVSQNFTINVTDLLETGVREFENDLSLRVYPVPAIDYVTVEVDNPDNKDLLLEIYSDAGKLVHSERTIIGNTIYLNEFPDGMYILRVSGENVYQTRKIVLNNR